MPDNGSGDYSLPPIVSTIVPNTTVQSNQVKTPLSDIEQALNARLNVNGSKPMTGDLPFAAGKTALLGRDGTGNEAVRASQLGTSAFRDVGATEGTVAAGDDARFSAIAGGAGVKRIAGVGDGVTDDTAAIVAAVNGLQSGETLDLQGKTWLHTISALNQGFDLHPFTTIRNGTFKLAGLSTGLMFYPRGTTSALTYTGGTIPFGEDSITGLSGLTAADVGARVFVTGTNFISINGSYKVGQYLTVSSVSGSNVTFENGVSMPFTTGIAFMKVTLKRGIRFEGVSFIGDPTKVQRAIDAEYLERSWFDVNGENVGDHTLAFIRDYQSTFKASGNNSGIDTDNGTDYLVVAVNGCFQTRGDASGTAFRHVFAAGNQQGVDMNLYVRATGRAMKDSVVDCHPGVLNFTTDIDCSSIRLGGTFANQPVGLMYQGGGMLKAAVNVDEYDTLAAGVQLFQNTADSIDITVNAINPNNLATFGLSIQVMKSGGTIEFIDAKVNAPDLSNAASVGCGLDTDGSAAGLVIKSVAFSGATSGKAAGKRVFCRSGHTINYVKLSGASFGAASGGYGGYVASVGGAISSFLACGNLVDGVAGSLGIRSLGVGRSFASGNMITGVGGAAITTNAIVGFTNQSGNDYT